MQLFPASTTISSSFVVKCDRCGSNKITSKTRVAFETRSRVVYRAKKGEERAAKSSGSGVVRGCWKKGERGVAEFIDRARCLFAHPLSLSHSRPAANYQLCHMRIPHHLTAVALSRNILHPLTFTSLIFPNLSSPTPHTFFPSIYFTLTCNFYIACTLSEQHLVVVIILLFLTRVIFFFFFAIANYFIEYKKSIM